MKTIKSSKEITTLEVGDKVIFDDLEYKVATYTFSAHDYYLDNLIGANDAIFEHLNINKRAFIENLGINADYHCDFPEVCSLEALTAIVSALFKEYEKQNQLPKTWEEFCKRVKIKEGESYIDCYEQEIIEVDIDNVGIDRDSRMNKNLCTSKQEAEAFLAFMQLRQLRKEYVKDWEPNWNCDSTKFCIIVDTIRIRVTDCYFCQRSMSFPTQKLAEQFLTNFKDLLEIAKPLL